MSWTRVIEALLAPPASLILLGGLGLVLLRTRRRLGVALVAASLLLLYLLSTSALVGMLLATLDRYPPLDLEAEATDAEAIVVLGAGTQGEGGEYGGATVSAMALERLRYGAWVHQRLERPLLVSGFSGALMAEALEGSFGVPVRWIEGESRNTHQNAVLSERILRADGVARVVLVTHFWHMPRAVAAFRGTELEVIPAPMGLYDRGEAESGLVRLLPRVGPLATSTLVFHEWLGRLWYRMRHGY